MRYANIYKNSEKTNNSSKEGVLEVRGHIVLIGMPAAGKSSLGAALAASLNLPCYDTDQLLIDAHKMSIAKMFAAWGEAGFRVAESKLLAELVSREPAVISLGGGAVLAADNRALFTEPLRPHLVIYLRAKLPTLLKNLAAGTKTAATRPLIDAHQDRDTRLSQLLSEREEIYAACATLTIDVDGLSLLQLEASLLRAIAQHKQKTPAANATS